MRTLSVSETLALVCNGRTGISQPNTFGGSSVGSFPVFVKPDTSGHKSDAGLVIEAKNGGELEDALRKISPEKAIIQEKISGTEIILGAKRDPVFGTVVLVGIGGTLAEAYSDVSTGVFPVSERDAERMLASLKAQKILDGFRGKPAIDRKALSRAISALGELADEKKIIELDINPLICTAEGRLVAVDGRAVLEE